MSHEIEEIKRILLKYNPAMKETLDEGIVESKSACAIMDFLNDVVNKEITDIDVRDVVLIIQEINKHEKKYYRKLREEWPEEDGNKLS